MSDNVRCAKDPSMKNLNPAGLLLSLPLPDQVCEEITMDFIEGLPKSLGKSTILVIVDMLTKYAHFIPFPIHSLPRL